MDAPLVHTPFSPLICLFHTKGHDYDDVETQLDMVDDHGFTLLEDRHDNAPSHESGSVPPGLDGQRDVPPDELHLNGQTKQHDNSATSQAESIPDATAVSDSAEASASVVSVSVKTVDDASAPGIQSAGDVDQSFSTQVQSTESTHQTPAPLQASDSLATIADTEVQETPSPYASTVITEPSQVHDVDVEMQNTQPAEEIQHNDKMDVPLSPSTASTALPPPTIPTGPRSNEIEGRVSTAADALKAPSANRLSISYASGTRRMVIDAEVVEKLKVFRSEARIEIHMKVAKDDDRFSGILVSSLAKRLTPINFIVSSRPLLNHPPHTRLWLLQKPLKTPPCRHLRRPHCPWRRFWSFIWTKIVLYQSQDG